MSEILVICSDGHHGDAIMVLPAICGLAERHDTVYLAMYNRQVLKIADLPENVVDALQSEPRFVQQPMEVLWLAAGAACDYSPGQEPAMSLIHRFMPRAGLPVDLNVLPQPRINVPDVAEHDEATHGYDVLLAPWTTAAERTMTPKQVRQLCHALAPLEVALVGGKDDPRIAYYDHLYGEDFAFVARTMRRAKCVVTVDAFPGRLAHASGIGPRAYRARRADNRLDLSKPRRSGARQRVARRPAGDMED